ncbi:carbonic anhydrase 12 [Lepeophtheirus salmonis]|uniref:carbonic anhydrase 12 n=1 Tax=Lepeophtheirus salmonis TaxID=72036 RepID=UPI001AE80FB1|nr:carbonic anhydrase 12-like [Lepeophtheirus salmonis]
MKKDSAVGICQDNACYCKDHNEDIEENVEIDPISPQKIWSYDAQEEWQEVYPMCKGSPQSPMNINSKDISDLKKNMFFKNFDISVSFIAINTGNGVRLLLQSSKHLTLTLDSLKSTEKSKNFSLSHIDLHWPYEEHSIDNIKSGVMEMQLYFFDSRKFCHYEDANKSNNKGSIPSIMAISLIFKLHNEKTDIDQALFKALTDLSPNNKVGVSVESKSYLKFIQQKMNYNFGNYKGTLTQPPCSKDLLWFVNQPSTDDNYYISTNQLHILQNIRNIKGERIINNVRQVQK